MVNKIIKFLESKGFLLFLLCVIIFGLGTGLTEWILNKTHYSNFIVSSFCIFYLILLSILKRIEPYHKLMKKMHNQKNVYEQLQSFYKNIIPLIQKDIPKTIYKYISLSDDRALNEQKFDCLQKNQIWFSCVDKLNDPFEGFNYCYLKDFALDLYPYFNIDERVENWKNFINKLRHDFYLASFTKRKDSMPMWAHYANNYCGYCVEYEVVIPNNLLEVKYWASKYDVSPTLENLQKEYLNYEIDRDQLDWTLLALHFYLTFIKSRQWEYEEEIRSVFYIPNWNGSGKTKICKEVGLKLKSIIVGCNCSEENRNRLNLIAQKLGIQITNMVLDFDGEFATLKQ